MDRLGVCGIVVAIAWYRGEVVLSKNSNNQGNLRRVLWHCNVSIWLGGIHFTEFVSLQISWAAKDTSTRNVKDRSEALVTLSFILIRLGQEI